MYGGRLPTKLTAWMRQTRQMQQNTPTPENNSARLGRAAHLLAYVG
jgi:hypothetical protein